MAAPGILTSCSCSHLLRRLVGDSLNDVSLVKMNTIVRNILIALATLIVFVILVIVSKYEIDKMKSSSDIIRISFDELHRPIAIHDNIVYIYGREEAPELIEGYVRYIPTMHLSKVVQRAPQNLLAAKDAFSVSPISSIYMAAASAHTMTNKEALLRQANDMRPDYYVYGPPNMPIMVLQTVDEIVIKWLK